MVFDSENNTVGFGDGDAFANGGGSVLKSGFQGDIRPALTAEDSADGTWPAEFSGDRDHFLLVVDGFSSVFGGWVSKVWGAAEHWHFEVCVGESTSKFRQVIVGSFPEKALVHFQPVGGKRFCHFDPIEDAHRSFLGDLL